MYLEKLSLRNFRSHQSLDLSFIPGVICFLGNNGQGKTNIVEAIGYLANQESHRVSTNLPLINKEAKSATITANINQEDATTQIEIEITTGKSNNISINKNPITKNKEALHILSVVTFAPEDLEILKGDPSARRAFIDTISTQLNPRVAGIRSDLDRVLKQRNSLLKSAAMLNGKAQQTAISTLSVFDERWVELAAELIEVRLLVLTQLEPIIAKHYQEIAPNNQIALKYQPSWIDVLPPNLTKLEIINALNLSILDVRTEELNRGVSLTGPHRDEIGFYLNELPVKGYASHGETWSLALSIKLANLTLLKESVNTKSAPILVLDDVFAELDDQRREQLMQTVAQTEQTFITAAAQVDLPSNLGGKIFRLENGVVVGG